MIYKTITMMKCTILVIEDSEEVRENISELLTLAGYDVIEAENGKKGLKTALGEKPDLILSDIHMPELDGYGVLRALENNPELCDIPFVFISEKAEPADFRYGMDLGADDYLAKPFTGDELLRIVAGRLKKRHREEGHRQMTGPNDMQPFSYAVDELVNLSRNKINKKYRKKDLIYAEGDTAHSLYMIQSGKIKIYKTNEFDKDYIVEISKSGEIFGYTVLFDDGIHRESAVAIENSEVISIPKQDFFEVLAKNIRLSIGFIKCLSRHYLDAEEKLLQLAYDSARKRVAEALLFISGKYNPDRLPDNDLNVQREDISALAGISPESVSRNLSDFKDEGLICTRNGYIVILDFMKLGSINH